MALKAKTFKQDCVDFFDNHPRTGWFLAITNGFNVLLNLLNLLWD